MENIKTYWNDQGKYQEQFTALTEKLVPSQGIAGTLNGELVRAVNSLYYDTYNNGLCNNKTGPFNFVMQYLPMTASNRNSLNQMAKYVTHEKSFYRDLLLELVTNLELMVDLVTEYVLENVNASQPFDEDMYDYSDELDDEDEDEDY